MKKNILMIIILSLSFTFTANAQLNVGVTKSDQASIIEKVNALFGAGKYDPYGIDIINVDSTLEPQKAFGVEDPYHALERCYVFLAVGKMQADGSFPKGFVGMYKDGNIIWNSPAIINSEYTADAEINTIFDINKDGNVDVITNWKWGGHGEANYIWIFSWDGYQGIPLNLYDSKGHSNIVSYTEDVQFIDLKGDGVCEIQGKWKTNTAPAKEISVLYAWNGQNYVSVDPLAFGVGINPPRNKFQATVNASVTKANDSLYFSYIIENKKSSLQKIENFMLMTDKDSVINSVGRHGWNFIKDDEKPRIIWLDMPDIYLLFQGEKDNFIIETKTDLPGINYFYMQGYNVHTNVDDIYTNSFNGLTISPASPPNPFIATNFFDTLTSFTTRSKDLGWIKQQPISDKYTGYFSTAKTALQKNQISLTRSTLTQVLHDVDADSSSTLTSEAYALIKYNTEYLLAHLPNTISALDMLDTLRVRTNNIIPNNNPCGKDFKEDLLEAITNAKKELLERDTISCAQQILSYERQLSAKYDKRKGKPCITDDEYNYLYPYAKSIVELLLPLPPKCGGSCKDKLFDLKSEIGRCTKKGYCSRGEFENGMEEQIDKAVKCIENKDSTGTATCLGLFEQEVQQTYEQTKKRYDERKYVKPEGYITLYYKAEYILEDLEH